MRKFVSGLAVFLLTVAQIGAFPKDVATSKSEFEARKSKVVQYWGNLGFTPSGTWTENDNKNQAIVLRKIAAGLTAMKKSYSFAPGSGYPAAVENWLWANVYKNVRVGTDFGNYNGDYDFTLTQIVSLLYSFKNDPGLLTNNAVQALVCQDLSHPTPCQVPYADQSLSQLHVTVDFSNPYYQFNASIPETENHVLMIYAWKYLINQWIRLNPRGASYVTYTPSLHNNEGAAVENLLLQALGRIVKNGFFETNARPYQAIALMPIFALYSYADISTPGGLKIRTAAKNALDYAAVQFAFQSLESKRYGPSRRLQAYKNRPGVYENDYLPQIFGLLSGAYVSNDALSCSGNCFFSGTQGPGFGLWGVLYEYRIPDAILDFHLRKDNHHEGYGAWTRIQARYTTQHYRYDNDPVYLPGGVQNAPDLSGVDLIRAPEFYFSTEKYMHSAGGDYMHYDAFDINSLGIVNADYDRFAKPSAYLPAGDIGYWGEGDIQSARNATMMIKGDETDVTPSSPFWFQNKDWWTSRNLGVYKNVVYGYSGKRYTENNQIWLTSSSIWPMSFPTGWFGLEIPVGNWKLKIFDLNSGNSFGNPDQGCYILATSVNPIPDRNGYWGFWEVIPKSRFPGANGLNDLIQWFSQTNSAYAAQSNQDINYVTATSNEKLTFQLGYGVEVFGQEFYGRNPIKKVNDDANYAKATYGDLGTTAGINGFPLIEVRQVDAAMHFTDVYYVTTDNNGYIKIRNPHLGTTIELDGRDWQNPKRTERKTVLPPILSLLLGG
jgi:hypothetical protein